MVLIKFFEDSLLKFRVVQIFEGKYSLNEFIDEYEKDFQYESFEGLQDHFLNDLETIFYERDHWGEEEELAYERLTKVRLNLDGTPVRDKNSISSSPKWQIQRTTDHGSPSSSTIIHALSSIMTLFMAMMTIYWYVNKTNLFDFS